MSNIERRISDFLRAEADSVGVPRGMEDRVLREAKTRAMLTLGLGAVGVAALVAIAVVSAGLIRSPSAPRIAPAASENPAAPAASQTTTTPSAGSREVRGCELTTPGEGFVPPEPYPSRPPELYDREWYGTVELWSWLDPDGEIWRDLPDHDQDGKLTEKLFLWSAGHASEGGLTPVRVTGQQLDGTGSLKVEAPGGRAFHEDLQSFMMVGLEIPPGCWELTATYGDAELSFVILVER